MIEDTLLLVALSIFVTTLAGLARISRGPTAADRLLAALLFGTSSVAILLLLSVALALPAAVDVALVFALLAAVGGVAFATRNGRAPSKDNQPH